METGTEAPEDQRVASLRAGKRRCWEGAALPSSEGGEPTELLLAGRRALEDIDGVTVVEDWRWYEIVRRWALRCRLKAQTAPGGPILSESHWYLLAEQSYPWGAIIFYPALEGGITQTFPHQNYNGQPYPTRHGALVGCAWTRVFMPWDGQVTTLNPHAVEERLKWHVRRCLEWLTEASFGRVVRRGDPYELPFFPARTQFNIAFDEGPETFTSWQGLTNKTGTSSSVYVRHFSSTRGGRVHGGGIEGGIRVPC